MTFDEFKEIRKKYNLPITFNDNIEAMSKEEYENLVNSLIESVISLIESVNSLIESIEDIYNDDSNEGEDF